MKLAIQQTSSQIEEGIEKSEEYRKELNERVLLINEENEKQSKQVNDLLDYQCELDRHFERVIYVRSIEYNISIRNYRICLILRRR